MKVKSTIDGPQKVMLPVPSFQKGYSFLLYGYDELNTNQYWFLKKSDAILDQVQKNNANMVSLVFPVTQDGYTGTVISNTAKITPTNAILRIFIREAHKRKIPVLLRPILDESNFNVSVGQWRGNIEPSDPTAWMQSYSSVMLEYARFAENEKVEMFSVGTELDSMVKEKELWKQFISSVRGAYTGKLVYSFNWNSSFSPELASQLDFIGIDAFYPLETPTEEQWAPVLAKMQEYENQSGKPVIFTEIGTRSQKESYKRPWDWVITAPVDQNAQADYYQSLCQARTSALSGWYVWYMTLDSFDINPDTDPSYDPTQKKAEGVIRDCYSGI